jgi:hypothetical protein
MDAPADQIVCNGINGATGGYWLEGVSPEQLAQRALGVAFSPEEAAALKARRLASTETYLGTVQGVDPADLAQAGWAAIFEPDVDPAIADALAPLLEKRKVDAGTHYREFRGPDGARPGESAAAFLARHGMGPGSPSNPAKVPYYLLIVGEPSAISYAFQYQLDVIYAVGRIAFDTPAGYATYAQSVVATERKPRRAPSAAVLAQPLAERLTAHLDGGDLATDVGAGATKERLGAILNGTSPPRLLFTASHGMAFPDASSPQQGSQGALLCQDWPGPRAWRQAIPESFYFAAHDVADDADFTGMMAFLFACYGAGTPQLDDFALGQDGRPAQIAPAPFVGALPRRLLGHPNGGALAVVGHVERAWTYSFTWPGAGDQLDIFDGTLAALLAGDPIGLALEAFNIRYAALAADLTASQQEAQYGGTPDPLGVGATWTSLHDARNYIVLGDPAVRLV